MSAPKTVLATPVIRRATPSDIAAFAPNLGPTPTVKAWVGLVEDRIVAIGGWALQNGRVVMFLDLQNEARPYKIHLMRLALRILDDARQCGIKSIYAHCDQTEAKSAAWLRRLGFEPYQESEITYRWSAHTWRA